MNCSDTEASETNVFSRSLLALQRNAGVAGCVFILQKQFVSHLKGLEDKMREHPFHFQCTIKKQQRKPEQCQRCARLAEEVDIRISFRVK